MVTTRTTKGAPLTYAEMDDNLTTLESDVSLRPLVGAVQQLINASNTASRDRANHTGQCPAVNVDVGFNGKTLEQCIIEIYAALAGAGPSAPVIASAPTIDDTTPAVGQLLTATATSTPGSTTTTWQWSANGVPISGATASTFTVQSAQYQQVLTVTQRSTNNTGGLYSESTSAATSAVSGTAPSNSVAPSISPNGSQAVGQTHTVSTGTWTGASTYVVQFYYNGVPEGARSSTLTIVPTDSKAGATLTFDVIAYSSLGIASSAVAGSNSVTLTGSPAVANTVLPAWPTNIYLNVTADFTEGTWTGAINSTREWSFLLNSGTESYKPPYGDVSVHTPRAPAIVGDTLYIVETVTETATGNRFSAKSTGKVISATPATLAVALTSAGAAGYVWTGGAGASPITQANPATNTGGTAPYSAAISPTISGLTVSVTGSNVLINGTPNSTSASTSYTLTVTDAVAATASTSFTAQIDAVSVQPLAALTYPTPIIMTGIAGDYTGSNVFSTTSGYIGPAGDGYMDIHRVINSGLANAEKRAELGWLGSNYIPLICQHEYWMSFVIERISGETQPSSAQDDELLMFQTHWTGYGDTQPEIKLIDRGQDDTWRWKVSGSSLTPEDYANNGGSGTFNWHDAPEVSVWMHSGDARPAAGVKWRYIIRYKPGWTAGHDKHVQIWRAKPGEAFVNICSNYSGDYTGINAYNDNNSGNTLNAYPRKGVYKYNGSKWNASPLGYKISKLYLEEGTSLFDRAAAAVVWAA